MTDDEIRQFFERTAIEAIAKGETPMLVISTREDGDAIVVELLERLLERRHRESN